MEGKALFQNIIDLIRENFLYLLRRYFLFSVFLLIAFMSFFVVLSFLFGATIVFANIISFFIGGFFTIFCAYFAFPFTFRFVAKKELDLLTSPSNLFDLYYAVGIIFAIFLTVIPLTGLFLVFFLFGSMPTLYYLMGMAIVTFFLQVAGGLFAKGADISAELIAKEHKDIGIDDARNVSALADKVGDFLNSGLAINLNLIEVFIGMFVAVTLYVGAYFVSDVIPIKDALVLVYYPIIIGIGSLIIGFLFSFLFLLFKRKQLIATSLKPLHATYFSMILIGVFVYYVTKGQVLPLITTNKFLWLSPQMSPFVCVLMGVIFSLIIGALTDIYTSDSHKQVKDNAFLSQYSSVLSIFNAMSVGMRTTYIPIIIASVFVFIAYRISDYYGIILVGIGFSSMLPLMVASSFSAPFLDTLNGVANMDKNENIYLRDIQQMNSVGNALSAVGKHASSYAVLFMAFSFFLSFVQISGINYNSIPLFHPVIMLSLFLGGVFPYIFVSALIRGLSYTVTAMYDESNLQLQEIPYLKEGKTNPDLRRFIRIHGMHILKDLLMPSLFIFFLPFLIGRFLSVEVLAAFFVGCIMVSTFLSISYTNSGILLGNAKNYIEKGFLGGKNTIRYANAIEADLYGDCVKDVLGPSINAFLKVVILITIIFVPIII
jgi:K(+)-stimulated pyrophosphate-energized sodium pump